MNTNNLNPNSITRHIRFWDDLPLARKLLLAFGILFIVALVIATVTLSGLNRTAAAYQKANEQGVQLRSISDLLTIDLLQARRAEKNFLLRWRSEGFDTAYTNYIVPQNEGVESTRGPAYIQNISALREDIKNLGSFGPAAESVSTGSMTQAQYKTELSALEKNLNDYDQSFTALVDALQKKGYNENTGLEGEFRTAAKAIEDKISTQAGLEKLQITFLEMRRNEKDYLARGYQEYAEAVGTLATELKNQINATDQLDASTKSELQNQLVEYTNSFNRMTELDKEIAQHNEEMIAAGRTLEASVSTFEKLGEQLAIDNINQAQANQNQTYILSIFTVVIALGLSIFLSIFLSRQLTRPVIQLTNTAEQIAAGNFEAHAEIMSGDEVGRLAQTFNMMTTHLGQAFEDVRRRALAVQTSAEVSRRLTIATSPRQLAVDVVEQVQAAFHYYHAHIYLVDENTGDLIMAGGTGEAGATMLARGHKIQKGRGLVGRAAESNAPILVPDVSKAEGWLPNPLLPETRCETAIPIAIGGQVLGVLDVQQNFVNGLGQEDVELLQSLAAQVAISLQNVRSYEESRTQAELEAMVNLIGQKIQRASTVEETLQIAVRELANATGAPRARGNIGRSMSSN